MSIKDFYTKEYDSKPKKKPSKGEYKGHMFISNELNGPASYADKIIEEYGFPGINKTSFYFIENPVQFNEVCHTIDFYLEIMEGYNFDRETAIKIASDNTRLFSFGKAELEEKLNILREFALDHEVLLKNTIINSINSKILYNIVQYLKALGIPVTIENIDKFYTIKKESIFEFNREIEKRRKNYIAMLIGLGCSKEEAKFILEQNPYILKMDVADLRKSTAILCQYGLDVHMLTRSEELKKINPKVLYAITETIKSMQIEVTAENIILLYEETDVETLVEMVNQRKLTHAKMGAIYSSYGKR